MILRGNSDTNKIEIRRRTVQRMSVCVRRQHSGTGVPGHPDLRNVIVKLELERNGNKQIIFHENLEALAIESSYFTTAETLIMPLYFQDMGANSHLYPLFIDLGTPINLQGDDILTFEASCTAGWMGGNIGAAGDCYIDFEWRDAIGVEKATPIISTKVIQASTGTVSESLGENVTSIALIKTGLSALLTDANAIYRSIAVTSDRYNVNDNLDRMIARRSTQFENNENANWRGNNWIYRPETEIDNVQVTATLNAANVAAGVNYIVYRRFVVNQFTINRGMQMEEKHGERNHNKFFGRRAANKAAKTE